MCTLFTPFIRKSICTNIFAVLYYFTFTLYKTLLSRNYALDMYACFFHGSTQSLLYMLHCQENCPIGFTSMTVDLPYDVELKALQTMINFDVLLNIWGHNKQYSIRNHHLPSVAATVPLTFLFTRYSNKYERYTIYVRFWYTIRYWLGLNRMRNTIVFYYVYMPTYRDFFNEP